MTTPLVVALAQLNSTDQLDKNLSILENLATQAGERGANVLFLPENALWMGASSQAHHVAQTILNESVLQRLFELAKRLKLPIHLGSYPHWHADTQHCSNRSIWIDASGSILSTYDKIHLFDVETPSGDRYAESDQFKAGSQLQVFSALDIIWGQSICFDLRFPELYRSLTALGAQVLLVPSAFTFETGLAHWHTLLRARAIENLAYVIAPAQVGTHATGRITYGHSLIVDPWGTVLADGGDQSGLLIGSIPRDLTQSDLRRRFQRVLMPTPGAAQ